MRHSFKTFFHHEAAGGILLMLTACLALILANSPADHLYFAAVTPARFWVNDLLMAIFFLLVGLEIKREYVSGALSSKQAALQPFFAAVGGMVVPALIFLFVTREYPQFHRGWAVPSATDIAFALGVLMLVGRAIPASVKILLTAIAILDDLGAILIIAFFYTDSLNLLYGALAVFAMFGLYMLNRKNAPGVLAYLVCGAVLWVAFLKAGIHPTLAGVVTALFIPMPLVPNLETKLHSFVTFVVLPVFALANAGLSFEGIRFSNLLDPLSFGVLLGLLLGKPVGILAGLWVGQRAGAGRVSAWGELAGMAFLCGIGFTMALFIGDLAFLEPSYRNDVKLGVLSASLLSAVIGWGLCRFSFRHKR